VDGSGNVYVTGGSAGAGTGRDVLTIKYNSIGGQQWVQRYNGPVNSEDAGESIAADNSGDVYVTGYSRSGTAYGTEDYVTIKYNATGIQQWVQRYNGPGNYLDVPEAIKISAGNIYVTGYSTGSGTNNDFATIKYNSSGVQQWVQRFSSPGSHSDEAASMTVDPSGSYIYVTGSTDGYGTSWDFATVKYNSSGVQQWVKTYNGTGNANDMTYSIASDGSGNCYVTGYTSVTTVWRDYATVKYNSAGVQQWVQIYHSTDGYS
jgi:hypothetical protein